MVVPAQTRWVPATVFADACREAGVTRSTSSIGSSADNAAAESFNASLKRETLQGAKQWPTANRCNIPPGVRRGAGGHSSLVEAAEVGNHHAGRLSAASQRT